MTIKELEQMLDEIANDYGNKPSNVIRFGKNGQKYIWDLATTPMSKVVSLINKYDLDQITDTTIWLMF